MFSWSKRIIRKIRIFFLDILAVVVLAGLGLFCLGMLNVLYATHLGFIILSIVSSCPLNKIPFSSPVAFTSSINILISFS